jgi:endoglucanase
MHHYEEIFKEPESQQARFLAIWEQIATRYKDYPSNLIFEILNEPNNKLTASLWNELLVDALAIIRQTNPDRNVIIGPADWNNLDRLNSLKLPEDDRHIIVTCHYYQPFHFTHQGAEWAQGSDAWMGTTWRDNQPGWYLENDLDKAARWSERTGDLCTWANSEPIKKRPIDLQRPLDRGGSAPGRSPQHEPAHGEFGAGLGSMTASQRPGSNHCFEALVPME